MTVAPQVIAPARRRRLRAAGLGWFDEHGRRFAFRGPRDPYLVLCSEVVLQQTQVTRGEPAWSRFTAHFPTFEVLAAASTADVLRTWSGLGYNRRALSLQRTARIVVERWAGRLPQDLAELERLPGVGPYTARAVAAICFGRPVAAVDTNVRRVVTRLVAPRTPLGAAQLQTLADALVPRDRPADWSAALMDIGSIFCRPREPACADCPLRAECRTAGHRPLPRPILRGRSAHAVAGQASAGLARRRLRGAIVERLRGARDGVWVRLDGGGSGGDGVSAVLQALERDGLIELDRSGRARLALGQARDRASGSSAVAATSSRAAAQPRVTMTGP